MTAALPVGAGGVRDERWLIRTSRWSIGTWHFEKCQCSPSTWKTSLPPVSIKVAGFGLTVNSYTAGNYVYYVQGGSVIEFSAKQQRFCAASVNFVNTHRCTAAFGTVVFGTVDINSRQSVSQGFYL